ELKGHFPGVSPLAVIFARLRRSRRKNIFFKAIDRISADQGWRLIVLATMSNLIFKALMVAALGHRQLLGRVSGCFGLTLIVGLFLLFR
ncbi:MAG: hypothetical protein L0220_28785, partial [Acidobacteria bacterium]|nr:hypothetical protein [Acidobacteriota bacterium]